MASSRALWLAAAFWAAAAPGLARQASGHAATLERNGLMPVAFPGWTPEAAVQVMDLSEVAPPKEKLAQTQARALVTPLHVVRLDETHAAMVVQAMPVGPSDEPMVCHACSLIVGAAFFVHDGQGWRLQRRQDAVVTSGVEGAVGRTRVDRAGAGRFVFSSEWGSCWQGYCGSWLVLMDVRPGAAAVLSPGERVSVDNDGNYGACSAIDGKPDLEALRRECLDIKGRWKIQGGKLVMDFKGRLKAASQDGRAPVKAVNQQAVYRLGEGRLVPESGRNPVPGF